MSNPGYQLIESPMGPVVELPCQMMPESNLLAKIRNVIHQETGPGIAYDYELSKRQTPSYIFFAPKSQLADFDFMDELVHGSVDAFYFLTDAGDSGTAMLVKKKDSGFNPVPVGLFVDGSTEQWYTLTLDLIEQITPETILE